MADDKIRLRALTMDDAKISWSWRNKDNIRYFYSGHPFFVNIENQEMWLDSLIRSDLPRTSFGIEEISTSSLVGMSFLLNIDLIHRVTEFSIFIGKENAIGIGYGKEATLKTHEFAFMDLNLIEYI
jgi:RimJ/RimL family protein N-acetyltransferase